MSIFKKLSHLFRRDQYVSEGLRIVFHTDTRGLGMHGLLRVSHADHRIEQGTVRFTFLGLKRPPQLTPRIMAFIWDKAHDAGYVVHSLDQYASVMDSVAAKSVQEVLSASRKRAEGTVAGVRDESIMQLREFAKEGATRYA